MIDLIAFAAWFMGLGTGIYIGWHLHRALRGSNPS